MSEDDLLDLLFIKKNATIAPTTKTDITIPAMPPAPIPDFLPPPPALPSDGLLLPPELRFGLAFLAGGVPGGGGGAGPELHKLPSFLPRRLFRFKL